MEKIKALSSEDIVANNIERLKEIFPTIFSEGKLVIEELQALLGEYIEKDKEFYQMTWAGKTEAQKEANKVSTGTLRPNKSESKDWDTTGNIFIEGDNLEVLKLLQKSYSNKIKMIYIDPPYNTGNDFIYKDNYKDNLSNYLELSGQLGEDGKKISSNTDSDGRYHSNWLNMMYPRLKLARNLLTNDGVIFISIDDNEQGNLIKMCNEIYGEENYVGSFAVQLNPRGRNLDKFIAKTHEHVLIFLKNYDLDSSIVGMEKEGSMEDEYNLEDNRGKYRIIGLRNRNQSFNPQTRPKLFYPLYINDKTLKVSVNRSDLYCIEVLPETVEGVKTCWTWGRDKVTNENDLLTAKKVGDKYQVFRKDYLYDFNGNKSLTLAKSLWIDKDINNDYGKKSIKDLFDTNIMDFPKSPYLIKKLLNIGSNRNCIVLDFFAGSGTTAQSVMELNAENGGNRKYISVQLPEPTNEKTEAYKAKFYTISAITKERIRRAGELVKDVNKDKDGIEQLDIGFRAFKLDSSNIQAWDTSVEQFEGQLDFFASNNGDSIKSDRTEEDVLFEILLKYGLDLTLPIQEKNLNDATIYNIGFGAMYICLNDKINVAVATAIGEWHKESSDNKPSVIFKDAGFANDADKTNTIQTLRQAGIENVKSI